MAAAEQVVRDYMRFVREPDAFKSDTAELDDRIKATEDPLQRLRLQQERVAASNPGTQLEEAFITHAKAYADEAGVDGRAFMAEGVSADVLTKAGLLSGRGRRPGGGGSRTRRSKRVGTGDIPASFTLVASRPALGAT